MIYISGDDLIISIDGNESSKRTSVFGVCKSRETWPIKSNQIAIRNFAHSLPSELYTRILRRSRGHIGSLGHSNHVVELQPRSSPAKKKIPSGCRCSSALYSLHTRWFTDARYEERGPRNVIADPGFVIAGAQQSFVCITLCGAWLYAYNLEPGLKTGSLPRRCANHVGKRRCFFSSRCRVSTLIANLVDGRDDELCNVINYTTPFVNT